MFMSSIRRSLVWCLASVVVLTACGGGKSSGAKPGGSKASLAQECPIGAIAKATDKPVTITVWHSMPAANEETLRKLTDRFNASQSDVRVNLVNQISYDDTLTKYKAALGGGSLPDLVQIQDVDQQLMIDSQSVLPAQACVEATKVDLSDFLPRVVSYYTVRNVLWAMPFATSNPILYYDKALFKKAGLDPEKPPTTLDELRADAQKIVSSGAAKYGLALKIESGYLEEWLAMGGNLFVDNGNGRDAAASKVLFGDAAGQSIFSWLSGMVRDKLVEGIPQTGYDNLFAVANGVAAMTMETSAALGSIQSVLASGQFKNVQLGVGRLPGPKGNGGTTVAGSGFYIVKKSPPERQEAAWRFAKYLSDTAQQADWTAGTGYIPIRRSATTTPTVQKLWSDNPNFKIAYQQLLSGAENAASAGPVIGDFEAVRTAVVNAEGAIFQQGASPDAVLKQAVDQSDKAIADYRSRLGG